MIENIDVIHECIDTYRAQNWSLIVKRTTPLGKDTISTNTDYQLIQHSVERSHFTREQLIELSDLLRRALFNDEK